MPSTLTNRPVLATFWLRDIFPIGVVHSQEEELREEAGSGSESGLRAILARNLGVQV